MITDQSCNEFVQVLASYAPVPGGGGAAALCGALSAALGAMAANYTVNSKKYAAVHDEAAIILSECLSLKDQLLTLVDDDAKAFEPLSFAYKIPKNDDNREIVLENATKNACIAPLNMIKYSCKVLNILESLLPICNTMLLSDIGCSASIARAALESAALNVYVNTKTLTDRAWAEEKTIYVTSKVKEGTKKAEQILCNVQQNLQ